MYLCIDELEKNFIFVFYESLFSLIFQSSFVSFDEYFVAIELLNAFLTIRIYDS